MKKAIVIVILVVYIASIAVVNFFGLEIAVFDKVIYTESILCDTVIVRREGGGELSPSRTFEGSPLFIFDFIPSANGQPYTRDPESLAFNPNAVEIDYKILPTNVTTPIVSFIVDEESPVAYFDSAKKTAVFLTTGMLKVAIKAQDGSNKMTQLYIYARVAP